jgi:diacylglycerol kinase
MSRKYSITRSFGFAFSGLKTAFKKEPNFRLHIITALLVFTAAYLLKFTLLEWLLLILTIFLVIVFELINTALEAVVNLASPKIKPEAKIAKDVSAAAVLLTAFFAIIVGVILFVPRLINFL